MRHQIDQILEELWRDERCTVILLLLTLYCAQSRLPWLLFAPLQMRHQIDQILEELWRDERCRECIRQHATASAAAAAAGSGDAPGGVFATFVKAVLADLMYLFKDSLERLASMKQIEDSKADAAVSGLLRTVFGQLVLQYMLYHIWSVLSSSSV
jgi:hypothetical protein